MKRFNRVIGMALFLLALLLAVANAALWFHTSNAGGKYHMVEINRIYDDVLTNGREAGKGGYRYVTGVDYLLPNAREDEVKEFFEGGNDAYVVKTIPSGWIAEGEGGGGGLVKFSYQADGGRRWTAAYVVVNVFLALMGLATILTLVYVKVKIVAPFNEVSDMPYELAKGHLTKGLREGKNRFFGRFVWGIDMLREHLEQRKIKELALVKEKKTLVLSISHDVKTPLAAIKLYAKALVDDLYGSGEKQREIAGKIDENADKIETFVNDIIQTSREDFLHIEVEEGEYYLEELVGRLKAQYADKLAYLKVEFDVKPFDDCLIYGDVERSLEAFENIMENAVKYGDGKRIEISFEREEDCCLVTVSNTGNTLSEGEMVHVFDSFWRGSNATDKKGNGLGLYICRQILMRMKGDIFVAAEEGTMNVTAVLKVM